MAAALAIARTHRGAPDEDVGRAAIVAQRVKAVAADGDADRAAPERPAEPEHTEAHH